MSSSAVTWCFIFILTQCAVLPFFTVYHEDLERKRIPSWLIFNSV